MRSKSVSSRLGTSTNHYKPLNASKYFQLVDIPFSSRGNLWFLNPFAYEKKQQIPYPSRIGNSACDESLASYGDFVAWGFLCASGGVRIIDGSTSVVVLLAFVTLVSEIALRIARRRHDSRSACSTPGAKRRRAILEIWPRKKILRGNRETFKVDFLCVFSVSPNDFLLLPTKDTWRELSRKIVRVRHSSLQQVRNLVTVSSWRELTAWSYKLSLEVVTSESSQKVDFRNFTNI